MRRIMYIEDKSGGLDGDGRIAWVEMSRTRRSYSYAGRALLKTKSGYKFNCVEEGTGDEYWVSGPSRVGDDKLYGGIVRIDEDARVEYWTTIRNRPDMVDATEYRSGASTRTSGTTARNERRARGATRTR